MSTKCPEGVPVNPLAMPKGSKLLCELCGGVATLSCPGCRSTYYCTKEHQESDWVGIHSRICQHIGALRAPAAVLGSEEERARRKKQTRETEIALIHLTRQAALKFLSEGSYEMAIPAALQTLRLSIEVYGQTALELVPAYLLLGELSVGLGKHVQAETYLSSAKWSILKNPDCPADIRASLHMNFGKLYAAMALGQPEKQELALHHFAQAVYYSALYAGPQSFNACMGYYQLGAVFLPKGETEKAHAMFNMSVGIAIEELRVALDAQQQYELEVQQQQQQQQSPKNQQQPTTAASTPRQEPLPALLSDAAQIECSHMLTAIHEAREQHYGAMSEQAAMSLLSVGMCNLLANQFQKAEKSLTLAYERLSDSVGPNGEMTELALMCLNAVTQRGLIASSASHNSSDSL